MAERIGDESVIQQLPVSLQRFVTWERFHIYRPDLFQNPSLDPAFDTRYFPQNCGAFPLPCFWIPRKHLYVCGRQTEKTTELAFEHGEGADSRILFPIHPLGLNRYKDFLSTVHAENAADRGRRIWAVPTSSTRTFLVWPDEQPERVVLAKTSLHSPIFGDRRVPRRMIGSSVGLSGLVQASLERLPPGVRYFPEPMGFAPRRMPDSGVLIRSVPKEVRDGKVMVAPLFSLCGGEGEYVPLFLTLLERSGIKPLELVHALFCSSFPRMWLELTLRSGLMLEAHGQNLMIALSPALDSVGIFYYRDFEGLLVDWDLRRVRGLPDPEDMPHSWSWYEAYVRQQGRFLSLAWYKRIISLFGYLAALCELESAMREWQRDNRMAGPAIQEGEVTLMFSRAMDSELERMFGKRFDIDYNIYPHLNRFGIVLARLRRSIMDGYIS